MDAIKNNWAKVVTENSVDMLAEAIQDLVANEDLRKQITANAVSIARNKLQFCKNKEPVQGGDIFHEYPDLTELINKRSAH